MQCFCGYSGTCSRSKRLSWIKPAFVRKASMLVFHLLVVLSIILPGYSPYKVQAASEGQENTRLGQLYSSPLWKHKENRITKNFADEILELSNLELDKTESNNEERDSTVERKGSLSSTPTNLTKTCARSWSTTLAGARSPPKRSSPKGMSWSRAPGTTIWDGR